MFPRLLFPCFLAANRNKDAATTTTTIGSSCFQHVGKKEDMLDLQQQLAHERRQNHPHVMLLARKALMRPTPRGIAAGRLQVMAASSSLAADYCDAVAVETPGSYRSWRAQWLRARHTFKLHPMQLFFLCTTTTNINKAAAKKTQNNSDGVIPVVRSRRALKQLIPPAPPLTIPPLPFTIIPPLPFSINPSPPGLTIPPFLPPPITFPPFPVTFPPLSSFTPPPAAAQKASVAMP
jgi:hypothetical protein